MANENLKNGVRPDSAWSWLVAIWNSLTAVVSYGAIRSMGVFYKPLMGEFGVEYGDASLLSAIGSAGTAFGAILPLMTRKYGSRATAMGTGLTLSLSAFISAFSPNLALILVFLGFITGVMGGSLLYIVVLTCNQYFDKHRSKAVGIAMLGVPLGGIILPPALDCFIIEYGWRGALIILSGLMLHTCVTAALYRPIDWSYQKEDNLNVETYNNTDKEIVNSMAKTELGENCDSAKTNSLGKKKKSRFRRILYSFHWKLFKNSSFVLMILSAITYFPAIFGFTVFLIPYGTERLHVNSLEASLLISLACAGDCVGKLIFGFVGDLKRINKTFLILTTTFLSGIFSSILTIFDTYLPTAVFGFTTGSLFSAYLGLVSVVYRDIVGLKELPHALTFHGFLNTTLMFPMIYVLGLSLERSGDARVPFYICSCLWILTAISLFVVYVLEKRKRRKK